MSTSRGRKILALITANNEINANKPTDVSVQETEEGCKIGSNCDIDVTKTRPNATPRSRSSSSSSSCSSSSSTNSSSSSSSTNSSSSASFKEDSDDSVKDPLYHPENLDQPESPSNYSYDNLSEVNAEGLANTSANEEITQRNEPGTEASNIPEATYSENIVESDSTPRAKKRKRNECGWKKNVVKKLRNTGKSYKSTATKKIVPERKMKQPCNEKCKLGCSTKFTEMDRKKLFDEYWQLGDVQKHWTYLSNCMTVIKPKYRYVREGGTRNKREYNNAFSFNLHDEKVRVCKLFFKNTLGITDRPIRTVMFKRNKVAGTILAPDYRGKHSNHPKVDESIRSAIKAHIESIPKIESHYNGYTANG